MTWIKHLIKTEIFLITMMGYLGVEVEHLLLQVGTLSYRPPSSGTRVGLNVSGSEEELVALSDCHLWTEL